MKYTVTHNTTFRYKSPVITAQHVLRLKPRNIPNVQWLGRHQLQVSIADAESLELVDYFGNTIHELRLRHRHDNLQIDSSCEIDVQARDEFLLDLSPAWESVRDALVAPMQPDHWQAAQFCYPSTHVTPAATDKEFAHLFTPGKPILRLAMDITQYIYNTFAYKSGITRIDTPLQELLRIRKGVCQDFAHLALGALRQQGLAARYVSGYILSQLEARPALIGAEASHAWISVFCPEFGWIDFDPTNNQMTSDQHIILAWGRDYADVAPTRGSILGGGTQSLGVDVQVRLA